MSDARQQDLADLNVLAIFHYIFAALIGLMALGFLIYTGIGVMLIDSPESLIRILGMSEISEENLEFAVEAGWILVALGGVISLLGWMHAALYFFAGRYLGRRRHHRFIQVASAMNFLIVPLGTVLSIFTFLVLKRPSIRRMFGLSPGEEDPSRTGIE